MTDVVALAALQIRSHEMVRLNGHRGARRETVRLSADGDANAACATTGRGLIMCVAGARRRRRVAAVAAGSGFADVTLAVIHHRWGEIFGTGIAPRWPFILVALVMKRGK